MCSPVRFVHHFGIFYFAARGRTQPQAGANKCTMGVDLCGCVRREQETQRTRRDAKARIAEPQCHHAGGQPAIQQTASLRYGGSQDALGRNAKRCVVCTYRTHGQSIHPVFGSPGHEGKNREMLFLLVPLISSCFLEFPLDSRRFFERILLTGLSRSGIEGELTLDSPRRMLRFETCAGRPLVYRDLRRGIPGGWFRVGPPPPGALLCLNMKPNLCSACYETLGDHQ